MKPPPPSSDNADSHRQLPELEQWLAEARAGQRSWSELAERMLLLEHSSSASHRPDTDRQRRCGFGEAIYGSGKTAGDIEQIAARLLESGQTEVLVTRVATDIAQQVARKFPHSRYDELGRTLRLSRIPVRTFPQPPSPAPLDGSEITPATICAVAILTAGSTDLPVAREALETLAWMGVPAELICDVGVAGPYRLLPHVPRLRQCACVVVVAGMEGALASVAGGLLSVPIIAVPTSVGYGANLQGVTTLLSMLSSCAAGVTVVNIDAGFKAGYVAGLIATRNTGIVATDR